MKKIIVTTLTSLFLIVSLTGCDNMSRRDTGTLVGAGAGAAIGGAVTKSYGGAAVGAVTGGLVGRAVTSD